jgi:hypothetical protein
MVFLFAIINQGSTKAKGDPEADKDIDAFQI